MTHEPPWSGAYRDAQQRVGEVRLSERDILLVSRVQHGQQWYARLRVHRLTQHGSTLHKVPGEQGLIVPLEQVAAVVAVLQQTLEAGERQPRPSAEEEEPPC